MFEIELHTAEVYRATLRCYHWLFMVIISVYSSQLQLDSTCSGDGMRSGGRLGIKSPHRLENTLKTY